MSIKVMAFLKFAYLRTQILESFIHIANISKPLRCISPMYLKLWVWHWAWAFDMGPGFFTSSLSFWHGANLLTCVILVCLSLENFQWPRRKYRWTIRPRSMGAIDKHHVCDWPHVNISKLISPSIILGRELIFLKY